MTSAKDDLKILFPEQKVAGYTVRPWNMKQLVALSPYIERLVVIAKEAGVLDLLLEMLSSGGLKGDFGERQGKIVGSFVELVPKLIPVAPGITCITIGISEEEYGELDPGTATVLLLTILTQNVEFIKNSFGLIQAGVRAPV